MNPNSAVSTNPNGGLDVSLRTHMTAGCEKGAIAGGSIAAGNTLRGPVTTGAFVQGSMKDHNITLQQMDIQGVGKSTSASANLNFPMDKHSVGATAFHERMNLNQGGKFDKFGGGVNWGHQNGHSASVGVTHVPKFNTKTMDASASANLWTSRNGATTLDATANATRHLSGPFAGRNNINGGIGLKHVFK